MDNIAAKPTIVAEVTVKSLESSSSHPHAVPGTEDKPFTLFERDNGIPYTAKFFGLSQQDINELKMADTQDMFAKMQFIDSYVAEKINFEGFFDSTNTFQQIIGEIKQELGIKEYEAKEKQIEKISKFLSKGKDFKQFKFKGSTKVDWRIKPQPKSMTFKNLKSLADFIHAKSV